MRVLGITGGVGSGKSEVLRYLEDEYGAYVCQMDETAKELQRSGTDCFRQIVAHFGERVVGSDGELDRAELGRIVFGDSGALHALNAIVHPVVLRWVREDIERKRTEGRSLYVVEAALLTETGGELCDELLVHLYGRVYAAGETEMLPGLYGREDHADDRLPAGGREIPLGMYRCDR